MRKIMSRAGWLLVLLIAEPLSAGPGSGKESPSRKTSRTAWTDCRRPGRPTACSTSNIKNAYFWALEKSVYVNVLFTAELDSDAAGMKEPDQEAV